MDKEKGEDDAGEEDESGIVFELSLLLAEV